MDLEALSIRWFILYYLTLGTILICTGTYLLVRHNHLAAIFNDTLSREQPPKLFRKILKYFFLFTLPCLVFSFFPFSWIELLFSVWSLLLVYLAGIQLVRWQQTRKLLDKSDRSLQDIVFYSGAIMLSVAVAIFLLAFLVINRTQLQ